MGIKEINDDKGKVSKVWRVGSQLHVRKRPSHATLTEAKTAARVADAGIGYARLVVSKHGVNQTWSRSGHQSLFPQAPVWTVDSDDSNQATEANSSLQ